VQPEYNTRVPRSPTAAFASVFGFLVCWFAVAPVLADQGPGGDTGELLAGEVRNVSNTCGRLRTLTVQFVGPISPRLEVPAGERWPISLIRGLYRATVLNPDGSMDESPLILVERKGFVWSFGCPMFSAPASTNAGGDPVLVRFANTTEDCGDPQAVAFVVNGKSVAVVPAGQTKDAQIPDRDAFVEVVSVPGNQRLMIQQMDRISRGRVIHYGCTEPGFGRDGDVSVVFQNATDSCASATFLTLWVDGRPRIGLAPGRSSVFRLTAGPHEFDVREGLTSNRVLQGTRDVRAPFRIRYGCNKQD